MAASFTTRLKCKPCAVFYKDGGIASKTFEGIITECEKCGGELMQIRVHNLKIKNITVTPAGLSVLSGGK